MSVSRNPENLQGKQRVHKPVIILKIEFGPTSHNNSDDDNKDGDDSSIGE